MFDIVGDARGGGERLTGQEAVELHQELEVDIVALGSLAVRAAHVVAVEINTYKRGEEPIVSLLVQACSE